MFTHDSPEFVQLLQSSSALRGEGSYKHAIALTGTHLPNINEECLPKAYAEILSTAEERGLIGICLNYASKLVAISPGNESAIKFL